MLSTDRPLANRLLATTSNAGGLPGSQSPAPLKHVPKVEGMIDSPRSSGLTKPGPIEKLSPCAEPVLLGIKAVSLSEHRKLRIRLHEPVVFQIARIQVTCSERQ